MQFQTIELVLLALIPSVAQGSPANAVKPAAPATTTAPPCSPGKTGFLRISLLIPFNDY
jgi:hypothetical protein